MVVVSHPQVRFTQAVLAGLAAAGAAFITCDTNRLPIGALLPLQSHSTQTERYETQALAGKPLKKRLWQQIVQAKILGQAALLAEVHDDDAGLGLIACRVRSGDPDNVEAQAARIYWQRLFGIESFRRDREAADQNRFLNYGYTVLRALVARGLCSAGLHPSFGIHHHNRYSTFALADDLMEPFRVLVDRAVLQIIALRGGDGELDKDAKADLIGALLEHFPFESERRSLFDIVGRLGASLCDCFEGRRKDLLLPEFPSFLSDSNTN